MNSVRQHIDRLFESQSNLRVQIRPNPNYDAEFPKEQFPLVVLIDDPNSTSPGALRWKFVRSQEEAEALKQQVLGGTEPSSDGSMPSGMPSSSQ